ncbi:hypothetical protein CYMTET_26281 [Cymbomonas tetramitiformis]|uniref:Uncharacterized protein n=1 Tax=Cymbomonas tetramitiformis TaxID=36881 RepID=A0AAE0KYD8_9CHLO|nr:hypothetical protein CYMTET_26281 [Cymbomonas tetramitiformis]
MTPIFCSVWYAQGEQNRKCWAGTAAPEDNPKPAGVAIKNTRVGGSGRIMVTSPLQVSARPCALFSLGGRCRLGSAGQGSGWALHRVAQRGGSGWALHRVAQRGREVGGPSIEWLSGAGEWVGPPSSGSAGPGDLVRMAMR